MIERRLAAIVFADVVGYSRRMGQDELAALSDTQNLFESVVAPEIAACGGRVIRMMGDGMIAEFSSAVGAVGAAARIQLRTKALGRDSKDPIQLRIGINSGEVIVKDGDIFGDGVNIAARIEALAEPGEIWVAASVAEQVAGRLGVEFAPLGRRRLKNIVRPVKIFRVGLLGLGLDAISEALKENGIFAVPNDLPEQSTVPSLVVLPFENLGQGQQHERIVEGIVEDITIELSRFRSFSVLGKSSAFALGKGASASTGQQRLPKTDFRVEGSVRIRSDQLRLSVRLVQREGDRQIWAEHYDCSERELFTVLDDIVQHIAASVEARLTQAELQMAKRKAPTSVRAYDYWLEGRKLTELWTAEGDEAALACYEKALALDETFARAYGSIAAIYNSRNLLQPGVADNELYLSKAFASARKAVFLDPADARNHVDLGWSYMLARDFDNGRRHFDLAGELNPNDANILVSRALALGFLGEADRGLRLAHRAIALNPLHPDNYLANLAMLYFLAGRYEEVIATIDRAPSALPEIQAWAAAAAGHLGWEARATAAARAFVAEVSGRWRGDPAAGPEDFVAWLLQVNAIRRSQDIARLVIGLEKAGLPRPKTVPATAAAATPAA